MTSATASAKGFLYPLAVFARILSRNRATAFLAGSMFRYFQGLALQIPIVPQRKPQKIQTLSLPLHLHDARLVPVHLQPKVSFQLPFDPFAHAHSRSIWPG